MFWTFFESYFPLRRFMLIANNLCPNLRFRLSCCEAYGYRRTSKVRYSSIVLKLCSQFSRSRLETELCCCYSIIWYGEELHSFAGAYSPGWTFGLPFRGFLITHIHTQTHSRTPPDEWSACRRGLYVHRTTQHTDTTDKHPCPQQDSNPRPQQPSGRSPRGHWDRHTKMLNCRIHK
jgi:hypothetical protein